MNKITMYFSVFLMVFAIGLNADEIKTNDFSDSDIQQIANSLPKDLFEALGGKSGILEMPYEITLKECLFNVPEEEVQKDSKKVLVSVEIGEDIDFSESYKDNKNLDKEAADLLLNKMTIVVVKLTPKIKKANECYMICFVKGSVFSIGAIDETGTDFAFGGDGILAYIGMEKFKAKMEAVSKPLLDLLLDGLQESK